MASHGYAGAYQYWAGLGPGKGKQKEKWKSKSLNCKTCSVFVLSDQGHKNALGNQELVWLFLKEIVHDILEIYNLS